MGNLALKIIEIAESQLGKEEVPRGSNWGKTGDPVPMYLKSVGINFPASWCMAFVYWCAVQAVAALVKEETAVWINVLQSYNPLYRTGGCLEQWHYVLPRFKVPEGEDPQPGDIGIEDHGHGLGHTWIVTKYDPVRKVCSTIEGNTNDEGLREGFEVCRRERANKKPVIGYIRLTGVTFEDTKKVSA